MKSHEAERLLETARSALAHAVAPASGFRVGAALLDGDGRTHTGANIENPSLTLTLCAERVALAKALSEGIRSFSALAVVSSDGRPCYPCGSCRQILLEFAPELSILVAAAGGVAEHRLAELLPHPFLR
jgi:cytidine deaminase